MKKYSILGLLLFISIGLIESLKPLGYVQNKPNNFNWNFSGHVRPVGDESEINYFADWTLAMTTALESSVSIKSNSSVKFSDQQVEDCTANKISNLVIQEMSSPYPNLGVAFEEILKFWHENGVQDDNTYPLDLSIDKPCRSDPNHYYKNLEIQPKCVPLPECSDILDKLIETGLETYGPAAVGIMTNFDFVPYDGSNIYKCTDEPNQIRYLLLVGYGYNPETDEKYWIARGFYDKSWGEGGYIKISKDKSNNCSILRRNICFINVSVDSNQP